MPIYQMCQTAFRTLSEHFQNTFRTLSEHFQSTSRTLLEQLPTTVPFQPSTATFSASQRHYQLPFRTFKRLEIRLGFLPILLLFSSILFQTNFFFVLIWTILESVERQSKAASAQFHNALDLPSFQRQIPIDFSSVLFDILWYGLEFNLIFALIFCACFFSFFLIYYLSIFFFGDVYTDVKFSLRRVGICWNLQSPTHIYHDSVNLTMFFFPSFWWARDLVARSTAWSWCAMN